MVSHFLIFKSCGAFYQASASCNAYLMNVAQHLDALLIYYSVEGGLSL